MTLPHPPLCILLTGATGMVGRRLAALLLARGHSLRTVSRKPSGNGFSWEQLSLAIDGSDAVIHLAGEPIADRGWSANQKQKIRDSRIGTLVQIGDAISEVAARTGKKPRALISTSAVGFFGDRGDAALTEADSEGTGFLADVCRDWEQAALEVESKTAVPCAILRVGVVLGRPGGMLDRVAPLFRAGLGGKLGSGKQWMSWIHVDDLVQLYVWTLEQVTSGNTRGVFHATSPDPVTNAEFTHALGHALRRPTITWAPAPALRLLLGERSALLLQSQRALPERALREGFQFKHPKLAAALEDLWVTRSLQPEPKGASK